MESSLTRQQIVEQALVRAGRDVGLRPLAEVMLNTMLRAWAQHYKFPILRKVGETITLAAGTNSIPIPSDFGAGLDVMLSPTGLPITEKSMEDFIAANGFAGISGEPSAMVTDQNAMLFRFNYAPQSNYVVRPIYFRMPADYATPDDVEADNSKLWFPDDEVVIQGLMHLIYQYNGDQREFSQAQLVEAMQGKYARGSVPNSPTGNRVRLSRNTFRPRRGL